MKQENLEPTFIPFPKKAQATRCSDYGIVSLTSDVFKILLNVLHSQVYRKLEENTIDVQFGFRGGLET